MSLPVMESLSFIKTQREDRTLNKELRSRNTRGRFTTRADQNKRRRQNKAQQKARGHSSNNSPKSVAASQPDLFEDRSTSFEDKISRISALHALWEWEDKHHNALAENDLLARQLQRCKDIGLIVFGFL